MCPYTAGKMSMLWKELLGCKHYAPAACSYSQTLHRNSANVYCFLLLHHDSVTKV